MLIVRPTLDLAKRMKLKLQKCEESSSTVLGDWFARGLVIEKKQYIFCMSEKGRLPLLIKAAPYSSFIDRMSWPLSLVLQKIGIENDKIDKELNLMKSVTVAKSNNRSIVSTMNECQLELEVHGKYKEFPHDKLVDFSYQMSDRITLTLKESRPREAVLNLFNQ